MDKKKIIGAILIIIIGVAGAYLYKFGMPFIEEKQQRSVSSGNTIGTINLALDDWPGYFFLRSPEMKSRMRAQRYLLNIIDDKANYKERMEKLATGEYQMAVATCDSHVLNDAKYASVEVAVLDQSFGGDDIVGLEMVAKNLDAIRGNNKLRVAFTPVSPSEFFGKATSQFFNLPELMPPKGDPRRIETEGAKEAIDKLLSGKADIAIGWQPHVARALKQKSVVKLLGTESTTKLVVDILLVPWKLLNSDPQMVDTVLGTYFQVLKFYINDNPDQFKKDLKADLQTGDPKVTDADVEEIIKGIKWVNLTDNCEQWFGISSPGTKSQFWILDAIESCLRILTNAGDKPTPFPGKDPARIVSSKPLERLFASMSGFNVAKPGTEVVGSLEVKFSKLNDDRWTKLREIGTLKMDPIRFEQGTAELDNNGKEIVDDAVKALQHYPTFRILVKGNTPPIGDETENQKISQERADAVARYLNVVYNVDLNRLHPVGFGGTQPLPKRPDEIDKTWYNRCARVELVLVKETL